MNYKDLSDLISNNKKSIVYDSRQLSDIRRLSSAFKNNGLMSIVKTDSDGTVSPAIGRFNFKDVISTKELYSLMPEVVTNILLDTIEPSAVISNNLFTEVPVPPSTTFNFAQVGPFFAGEVSELGEYPEVQWDTHESGMRFRVSIRKYGMLIKVSDEVIRDNLIGIYALFLRKAGQALIRKREAVCQALIQKTGEVVFDNANPTNSVYGSLAGRAIDGSRNGTPTAYDILQAFSRLVERGFTPDVILIHPFAWSLFAYDPELKEMFDATSWNSFPGNKSQVWNQLNNPYMLNYSMTGNPTLQNGYNQTSGSQNPGELTAAQSLAMKLGPNPYAQTSSVAGVDIQVNAPSYLSGNGKIKVLISPYVRLQKLGSSWTTDIIFADSKETGVILRGSNPTSEEWSSPEIDAKNLKIKEEYGIGLINMGKAVNIMKNVVVDRNYIFNNVNQATLAPINRENSISF